jgi:multidrug efflux pump subunit AcrB
MDVPGFKGGEGLGMIALVRIALRRPYTFVVLALTILIVGPLAALRTPVDIFPDIRIPVIAIIWNYTGLQPDLMVGRIVTQSQRGLTTTVNDIEHLEATSYNGLGIIKVFFQPNVDIRIANAQVTAVMQTQLKQLPPNATPPLILNYNASTVPIIQVALSGSGLSEQMLADIGLNVIRTPLVTVPGAAIPFPYGGKTRQVQIDLDPEAMQARGLSGADVANALAAQNLITPVGSQKIGGYEYAILLNNSPLVMSEIGDMPIKSVNGAIVYIRDVAHVRDGNPPQTNIVHVDGNRSVLLTVLKNGSVSTLDIIAGIKNKVDQLRPTLPKGFNINLIGDQSVFVRGAVSGVVKEGVIAAALTSLMILIFLGSWRSTVIIATSIPLSVLGSIAILAALGETLNIMTLGGLALAVGILVDDATVTIENINWHLEQGKKVEPAILDGAAQIVTPAFVSLLCICIVFVPMFFLPGVSRFLFVPMAEAVMAAMACSFILSRTLVPTMANYLLRTHAPHTDMHGLDGPLPPSRNPLVRLQRGFERGFERVRQGYRELLIMALARRRTFLAGFLLFVLSSFALLPFLGRDFFPAVDAGQILMHARLPVGTRVEESANRFADIQKAIRQIVPPEEIATIVDNIGSPVSGINTTYNNTGTVGSQDGDIQIKLSEDHRPVAEHVQVLREELPRRFPGVTFSFLPADIISQILNFGAPAPIDVQVRGKDLAANYAYAQKLQRQLKHVPGLVDVRIQQSLNYPGFNVDVDRTRAQAVGLTERDVTNSMVVNLAGSSQVAPTYWLNPENNVNYAVVMQTPQYKMDSLNALRGLPITASGAPSQTLGAIADFRRVTRSAVVSQYNILPVIQIYGTTQGRDLGAVATQVRRVIDEAAGDVPPGTQVELMGQARIMDNAFRGLLFGLLGAIVLIYLLIVVNFQSWRDPFVIITALPAALAGIVWMLFATATTLSVPALTGAIMCMGIATANSVLVISFARERLAAVGDAVQAAIDAGFVRFRPVLMTAFAMMIGMAPMALGLGEGGEQNAPLGRAVIGGLIFATIATLMFVPVVFSMLHARDGREPAGALGDPHAA